MYCWNCGQKNPDENRFCGQCGKRLVQAVGEEAVFTERKFYPAAPFTPHNPLVEEPGIKHETITTTPAATNPESQPRVDARPVQPLQEPLNEYDSRRVPPREPEPGRNSPANRITGPSFLGLSDESAADSSDPDYLLNDEEPRSYWRTYLALAILILLGILIVRHWSVVSAAAKDFATRNHLTPAAGQKPSAAARVTESSSENSTDDATAANTGNATAKPTTPEESKPESDNAASKEGSAKDQPPIAPTEESATSGAKSSAPQYDNGQVELAQKYLQGRGVAQDCSRGISLLRSAARQGNPKANIQMGALYATGHCVSLDRAQAYHWFAQARQLEPGNNWVDRNMNSLWASMSNEERQRAEKIDASDQ